MFFSNTFSKQNNDKSIKFVLNKKNKTELNILHVPIIEKK